MKEFKGKLSRLEVEVKALRTQRESDENKVRLFLFSVNLKSLKHESSYLLAY